MTSTVASSAAVLINESPRPRLLVAGFADRPELVAELLALAPTSRQIRWITEVRQAEWDVLITDAGLSAVEDHLCVVYVRPQPTKGYPQNYLVEAREGMTYSIHHASGHISTELKRLKNLPERVAQLTHEQLEPVLKQRPTHHHFFQTKMRDGADGFEIEPFVLSADDHVLAGRYRRGSQAETWLLPTDTPDVVAWARAALAEWHNLAPERFPGVPDWSQQPEWLTDAEREVAAAISGLESERDAFLHEFENRQLELRTQMRAARAKADSFERALLTTQSDELKHAVLKTLEELGYKVDDADLTAADRDHLEDLHITDPDQPGWIALAEVKGYTRGAKTEGIGQFLRFNMRYVQRTGRGPDRSWYIVNQFMNRDPSTRQPILHGKDEDIDTFAQAGGLVIDTVALFRLLMSVRKAEMTSAEARTKLSEALGRFEFTPAT